jgi:proline iminopeptidase
MNLRNFKIQILQFLLILLMVLTSQAFGQSKYYTEWYLSTPDSLDAYSQDIYVREVGAGKDTVIVIHGGFGANHDYMLDAIKGLEKKLSCSPKFGQVA